MALEQSEKWLDCWSRTSIGITRVSLLPVTSQTSPDTRQTLQSSSGLDTDRWWDDYARSATKTMQRLPASLG